MNNIEVKIDYFSVTFPLQCDDNESLMFKVHEMVRLLALYLNVKRHEIVQDTYSQNNYNYQYHLGEFIVLRLDGPLNRYYQRTCHLELKGDACRDFETRNKDKNWINFILFMTQLNSSFKRIDIAIDDYKGDVVDLKWLSNKIKKHLYTSVFKSKPRPIGTIEDGMTIQFGGNESDVELVIYDKKKERIHRKIKDSHIYWLRYEMRFRNKNCERIAYKLAALYEDSKVPLYGTKLQKFAFEQLYRLLDFKEDNSFDERNQYKAETDSKWIEFLQNVSKGELRKPDDENPLPSSYDTYEKQGMPYFVTFIILKWIKAKSNIDLFNIDIFKSTLEYLNLSKKRFQKLNMFLDQLAGRTIDMKELEILKNEFKGIIDDKELPF